MGKRSSRSIHIFFFLALTFFYKVEAQDAFHNYGNLRFHSSSEVGFHIDLIDDGTFDENQGLTGFYSSDVLSISGSSNPVFEDLEIFTDNGLQLETWVGVTGNANFISGDVITSKASLDSYLNFIDDAFFTGTGDNNHVNGYAGATNKTTITFPVGEGQRIRHLTLNSKEVNSLARCAYFFEDPNSPVSLGQTFSTDLTSEDDLQVNTFEFWKLQGEVNSIATLTWDTNSNAILLAESIENLVVVGWSKTNEVWENLGNTDVSGNLDNGSVTSSDFVPDDYEIITLGGTDELLEPFTILDLDNYFMTPNGDGINDFLVIDGIENFPNNTLNIYNRYGIRVYSKMNYNNEFNGKSNRNSVISRDSGLSAGIYFYILTVDDLRQKHQGYLYISD